MNQNLRIKLTKHGELWVATCEGIECGGSGATQEAALKSFAMSMFSTFTSEALDLMHARPRGAVESESFDIPIPTLGFHDYAAA